MHGSDNWEAKEGHLLELGVSGQHGLHSEISLKND
jgi:hypothetical protein